jgi:nitroreductase
MKTIEECKTVDLITSDIDRADVWGESWSAFKRANRQRRAIRDFDGVPIPDAEIVAILNEGLLAPSSSNAQPFVIHWLRTPALKAAGAAACRNQRAARSAATLLVFVAANRFALETTSMFRSYVESTSELGAKAKAYHLQQLKTGRAFLRIAPSVFWSPLYSLLSTLFPSLSLIPLGPKAVRNWAARNALFAAQTVMLAASARGLDTCPMEGFSPQKLSRILGLKRGDVIPIVVAVGHRRVDALLEPRWRRSFEIAVHAH